jgi:hypothetical protein
MKGNGLWPNEADVNDATNFCRSINAHFITPSSGMRKFTSNETGLAILLAVNNY